MKIMFELNFFLYSLQIYTFLYRERRFGKYYEFLTIVSLYFISFLFSLVKQTREHEFPRSK